MWLRCRLNGSRTPNTAPKRPLASFECFAPPKAPSERGPPAWIWPGRLRRPLKGPLRQAPYSCTSSDLGGEEGGEADRVSPMLELPLGGGSGERHVQKMPERGRRDPLNSNIPSACRHFTIRNDLFITSFRRQFADCDPAYCQRPQLLAHAKNPSLAARFVQHVIEIPRSGQHQSPLD